jgi:hypothetical protein
MRKYEEEGKIVFKNMEERFKNEFFTIVRTIQRIVMKENKIAEEFVIAKDETFHK